MPVDDLGDLHKGLYDMQKAIERIHPVAGDSAHSGSGGRSLQLGPGAEAVEYASSAFGSDAYAGYQYSTAIGAQSNTTAEYQVMLGHFASVVVVAGRFRIAAQHTPAGTGDTDAAGGGGYSAVPGDICNDDDYLYVYTNAGWKRTALSTF